MPDVNPTAPRTPITLDRPRYLQYDFEAYAAIEDKLGATILNTSTFWENLSSKNFPVVLWAGLLDEDPTLKFEDLKAMIRKWRPEPLIIKVLEAWRASEPEAAKANPTPEAPAAGQ